MKLFARLLVISILTWSLLNLTGCVSSRERCLERAESGDGEAQGILGSIFLTGSDEKIDYRKAYYWLRLGAANGDSAAAYYLGVMYQYGLGKIVPDQMRAQRHYKSVYKDIHAKAKENKLAYINILAEMYYYGRGLKQDKKVALKMFKFCAKRNWIPAVENLGVILLIDKGVERDFSKAKSLLIKATMHNYPRAHFYLAEYYFDQGQVESAMKHLEYSVRGGYPPAMFKLAEKYREAGSPKADSLFKAAATEGYAPAMYVVANNYSDIKNRLEWLKKATQHSYIPAMLEYADSLKEQITPDPCKEMILYLLAEKIRKGDPEIKELILNLDNKTGLYFPLKYTWENIYGGENILLASSEINRVMQGYKAGIVEASKKLFQEKLAYNPLPFFMNNDWYKLYENGMPPLWSGLLFKAVEKHEEKNPGFWISYGISAGLAGQGTCQAYAAYKLDKLAKERQADKKNDNSLLNISALMKANALILMNYDNEAYNSLFDNGNLMREELPHLINFINLWCRPLLKDKRKFSVASGIEESKLGEFMLPQTKDFWSLEYGKKINSGEWIKEPVIDFDYYKK
jgi:TPR repeat protein